MAEFKVKIIPNASVDSLQITPQGIKIRIAAPAVDGKANIRLVSFLAKHCKIKKGAIQILKGATSQHKLISLQGVDQILPSSTGGSAKAGAPS